MSVSSVSSGDPYATQSYNGEEDKTGEQTGSQQPENTPQSSSGNGDEARASADDSPHQDDASQSTASSDPANTSSSSSSDSGDSQASADDSHHQDDVSQSTASSDPANTSSSSSGDSGDSQASADDSPHQDEASQSTASADPANTSSSSSGDSGGSQASAGDNHHQGDVSNATASSASSHTPQSSRDANGGDTVASTNGSHQQPDAAEKMGNTSSENASSTRSDIGNHDQVSKYSGTHDGMASDARGDSAAGGVSRPPGEYSVPPQVPGGDGKQQGPDSGSQNRLPEQNPSGASTASGAAGDLGKSSGNDGHVPENPSGQGAISPKIEDRSPSENFITSPNPKTSTEPDSRPERDVTEPPKPTDDKFADHVVSQGQKTPLTDAGLNAERWKVVQSVERSLGYLADPYTAATIGRTLIDALNRSPTFRDMVSYGLNNNGGGLNQINFSNRYVANPNYHGEPVGFEGMAGYLRDHPGETMPIFASPARFSQPQMGNGWGRVNIGVAPSENSENLPVWRDELIHEVVHHLTGARDPVIGERRNNVGPTEILAQRVMHELGYPARLPSNYASLTRAGQAYASDRGALRDAVDRNAGREQEFFQRLGAISPGQQASRDFHEIQAPPPDGTTHNRTDGFTAEQPPGNLAQLQFDNNGTVTLFPFAQSAPAGAPTGYQSAYAASSASWDTQGRFFQYGTPVDGNPHMREFAFPDGSKVVVSAHVPQAATSDLTKFKEGMAVVGGALAGFNGGLVTGGVAGFAGGPVGLVLGSAAGAAGGLAGGIAGGIAYANSLPYDRIWQGYTLDYYNNGETKPFYTQYMYGWDADQERVKLLVGQPNANLWPDYADGNPDGNWNWWKWRTGDAPLRT